MVVIFLKVIEINSLVLAYLGDTIYENYVRKFLIRRGIAHVDELQKILPALRRGASPHYPP